jgi:hypothetical protein
VSGNPLRPMRCQLKRFTNSSKESAVLNEVGQVGDETALREDEKGASQDV